MKKEKKLIIIIVVVILAFIVIAIISYNSYAKKNNNTESNNKPKEAEKVFLTEKQRLDIYKKVMVINLNKGQFNYDEIIPSQAFSYNQSMVKELNSNSITETSKIYTALMFSKNYFEPIKITYEEMSDENKKVMDQNYNFQQQISEENVRKLYKKIFGKELKTVNPQLDYTSTCPGYTYDSNNKVYLSHFNCGGSSNININYYINRIELDNNMAYAYLSVDYSGVNAIDASNYKNFKEYKITFKKANDNLYYYVNLE